MTLGEKIRLFREFRGLTQEELGVAVGFKEDTAGSRIRKYESNTIAPKTKIRTAIARALDIDISLLNDNNLSENIFVSLLELQQILKFDVKIVNEHIIFELPMFPENNELYANLRKWAEFNKKMG